MGNPRAFHVYNQRHEKLGYGDENRGSNQRRSKAEEEKGDKPEQGEPGITLQERG